MAERKNSYRAVLRGFVSLAAEHEGVTISKWVSDRNLHSTVLTGDGGDSSQGMSLATAQKLCEYLGITLEDYLLIVWGFHPTFCLEKRNDAALELTRRLANVANDYMKECNMCASYLRTIDAGFKVGALNKAVYEGRTTYTDVMDAVIRLTGIDPRVLFRGL